MSVIGAEGQSLRERQQAAVRAAIVEGYMSLCHRDGAIAVSMRAVAEQAGVAERTVYRYFPNKDDLQTAAAYHLSDQALQGGTMADTDLGNFVEKLTMLWTGLAENIPAVFAERASPAGRQFRVTRLRRARPQAAAAFPDGATPETVDLVVAVTSSSMFLELVDRMGYQAEDAAKMAARLVHLIIEDEKEKHHVVHSPRR